MSIWWDGCNKWLYVGSKQGQANQLVILLDNWLSWSSKQLSIKEWTLFQIMWDNGAWWECDLNSAINDVEIEHKTISHMNGKYIENDEWTKRTGLLNCFFQVTIIGIGFRYQYKRKASVLYEEKK